MQRSAPSYGAYPYWHGLHARCPVPPWYWPRGHAGQIAALLVAKLPRGHGAHLSLK